MAIFDVPPLLTFNIEIVAASNGTFEKNSDRVGQLIVSFVGKGRHREILVGAVVNSHVVDLAVCERVSSFNHLIFLLVLKVK